MSEPIDFKSAMDRVMLAVSLLRLEPIDELREMVERAETLGPILEPTAYQRGGGTNLYHQRLILDAVANLARVADKIAPTGGAS